MSVIEITSMSTKGQVVIPASMRKNLHIQSGSKLIVVQDGDNILLKPITKPHDDEFKNIIKLAEQIRNELDLNESDISKAIKATRESRESRR